MTSLGPTSIRLKIARTCVLSSQYFTSTKLGLIWLLISTGNCSRSPMLFTLILSCTSSSDTSATTNFNIFFQVFLAVRSFIWWESYTGSWRNFNQLCSYSFRSFCTFPLFSQKLSCLRYSRDVSPSGRSFLTFAMTLPLLCGMMPQILKPPVKRSEKLSIFIIS